FESLWVSITLPFAHSWPFSEHPMLIEPPCVPSLVAFGRCLAGWTGMVCSPATVGRHRSVSLTASHPEVRRGHESCQEKERANVPVSLEPAPPKETVEW